MKSFHARILPALILTGLPAAAALRPPYTADPATVHLYHFSEAAGAGATVNAGSVGNSAYAVDANPLPPAGATTVLGAAGFTGFGNAADFTGRTDHLIGYDGNASGGFDADTSGAVLSADAIQLGSLGINGGSPFTLETMVKFTTAVTTSRELICTDSSATTRGFQFRVVTGGPNGHRVEFNLIGVANCQRFGEIPNTGDHAYALNQWFHVAMVYSGTAVQFYWTKVDPATATVNPLGAAQAMTIVGGSTISGPLALGNDNRNLPGEGVNGAMDEVRISTVARTPAQFLFFLDTENGTGDGLDDTWELTYFPDLSQLPGGDPDLDGFNNLTEFNAGSNPNSLASTPDDLDADGLQDAYEVSTYGSIGAQSGGGDPDGDYATNSQEAAASTAPLDRTSFPDTESGTGDGMGDAWETLYFGSTTAQPGVDSDNDGFTNLEEFLTNSHPLDPAWTPVKAKLRNRWSFNNVLTDSTGTSPAVLIDPDNDAATGGVATLSATGVQLGGGARATSSYIQLGTNLLQGLRTPVTLELWATQTTVQNWSRIFDFGAATSENLFMSWTQAVNVNSDAVSWVDAVTSTGNNTSNPYTPGAPFHILMSIEPGAGLDSSTLVTWYARAVGTPDLGAARGSFSTANNLSAFNDAVNWLGRSQYEADATANASYDEFRIWNGALTAEERERYHDAGPNVTNLSDTDNDSLPDDWEIQNFMVITAEDGSGDPDRDLFTNLEEYTASTNPNRIFSSPDTDADTLPDGWEVFHFRASPAEQLFEITAKFSGQDDPDGDYFTNQQEFAALTNPNLTVFTPIDTDGDGLIDSWEQFYFMDLDETGAGQADGDSATNLAEQAAGSNPTLTASTPADADGDGIADNTRVLKPYAADADTLHLWHLDQVAPASLNAVPAGPSLTSLGNGALLWTPSVPGFLTSLSPAAGRGTANAGLLAALPLTADAADNTTMTLAGADGAFTFEALVRIDFDPAAPPNPGNTMQIISGEGDIGTNRIFQFRILPTAGAPVLQFVNIRGETAVETLAAPLPLSGAPEAIAQGNWYHAAVAYNGAEATPDNFRFFWTLLDPARAQATQLAAAQMANDLIVEAPDFVIGNEGRSTGGSSDAFAGVIDEVRISSIARTAQGFLFSAAGDTDGDGMPDAWETTYFGGPGESAAGDFDKDGTNNLSEYRLGLLPNNGASRFNATLTGPALTWPSAPGLSFTVQRSVNLSDAWTPLATLPAAAGATTSYTDPSPPAGRAYYRVLLNGN